MSSLEQCDNEPITPQSFHFPDDLVSNDSGGTTNSILYQASVIASALPQHLSPSAQGSQDSGFFDHHSRRRPRQLDEELLEVEFALRVSYKKPRGDYS